MGQLLPRNIRLTLHILKYSDNLKMYYSGNTRIHNMTQKKLYICSGSVDTAAEIHLILLNYGRYIQSFMDQSKRPLSHLINQLPTILLIAISHKGVLLEYNQCKHGSVWDIHTFRTCPRGYTRWNTSVKRL